MEFVVSSLFFPLSVFHFAGSCIRDDTHLDGVAKN